MVIVLRPHRRPPYVVVNKAGRFLAWRSPRSSGSGNVWVESRDDAYMWWTIEAAEAVAVYHRGYVACAVWYE